MPETKASNGAPSSNGGIQKIAIAAGLLLLGYTINSLWTLRDEVSELKGRVQSNAQMQKDVSTALAVLQNHGQEFEGMRQSIAELRGATNAWRTEVDDNIREQTRDRFYKTEWLLEKQRIAERHAEIQRRIDDLEALHQRSTQTGPGGAR